VGRGDPTAYAVGYPLTPLTGLAAPVLGDVGKDQVRNGG